MKRFLLFAVLALVMSACANPNAYTIKGNLDDATFNGQKVILYQMHESGLIGIDSTVVEKNAFAFKGKVDSTDWYVLMIQKEQSEPIYKDFYLSGKLKCEVKAGRLTISGSDVNDIYQKFEDTYMAMTKDLVALNEKLQESPNSQLLKAQFNTEYQKFQTAFGEYTKTTIIDNIKNPLGYHLFEASISSMSNNYIEEIVSKGDQAFLSKPMVKMVVEQLNLSKKVADGNPCPDLKMMSSEDKMMAISDYVGKGNYVLIDFWASWCAPCIQEMPNIVALYNEYHSKGFEIVGVSLDEEQSAWKASIKSNKMKWPQMSDLSGWKSQAVSVFAFNAIPHTVLVDPKGMIVAKNLRGEALKSKLKELYK